MSAGPDTIQFDVLLDYLKRTRAFDFSGYKRSSLMRRIHKRMQMIEVATYGDYIDYLEVHPQEFALLFNTILINVTSFFRDAPSWEFLAREIVPRILVTKPPNEPIRVWDAGCASGEEAYTIAIVLAEALGDEQFRDRVKIYATDVDEEALAHARQASYGARDVAAVPTPLLATYFEQHDNRFTFRKELRRAVIFGRHDLVQDAPISRVDLLICRNTLMYFNGETQGRILARLNFALNDAGFLFLGRAEMLFTHASLFMPIDLKRRIFAKMPRVNLRDRLMIMAQTGDDETVNHLTKHVRFREASFDLSPVAQIVVDLNGLLSLANERARALLNLTPKDLARPLQNLEIAYRLGQLRALVERVYVERLPTNLKDIEWATAAGDLRFLDIQVAPLLDSGDGMLGVSIAFTDVTLYKRLQEDLEHTNQELETAYEELQSTNEELETTNEELQSTIEELETTNEELQSTNEELETMNEELQSTNEELQTINDELRRRTDEINQANAFLESILTSLGAGVVVVDRDLRIQVWNRRAEDLWGLRSDEVTGQHFLNLDIGLPVEQIRQPIRACLAGKADEDGLTVAAINRRGRGISCHVECAPLFGVAHDIRGVILLMDEQSDGPVG